MPDLTFDITAARTLRHAMVPTLALELKITNAMPGEEVYAAALKCQIMIEAVQRKYSDEAKDRLYELFGEPGRWPETLRSLFWRTITIPVPRFTGFTVLTIPIDCGEDMATAAGNYFHAISDGDIPLAFLFSGTVFYKGQEGALQVTQVEWHKEAAFRLPLATWTEMMDIYFPDTRTVRIRKDIFEKLCAIKAREAQPTLEACLETLLDKELLKSQSKELNAYER